MSAHNILCYHTMVGSLMGTDNYFDDSGYYGVESHFGTGGSSDGARDGHIIQWQDTDFCADANLDGKPDVISVETSDGGDPNRPWSPKQLDANVDIGIWVCRTYGIPPVLVPDTKPGRRGIAYHRQGCDHSSSYRPRGWPYDAWRVPGGVRWSGVLGKVCPGDVRIRQLVDIVIPRIKAGLPGGGGSAPSGAPRSSLLISEANMRLEDVERGTLSMEIPERDMCLQFQVAGEDGTPGSTLQIHSVQFVKGNGRKRTVTPDGDGIVPAGDPWWGEWLAAKNDECSVIIRYSYTGPGAAKQHIATAGWRRNYTN